MNDKWKRIKETSDRFKDLTRMGLANMLGAGISGIFWFILASMLKTEQYGEISYLYAIASIASVVAFIGVGQTIIVYTAKEKKIQSSLYFLALISSIITSLVLFILVENVAVSLYVIGYTIFNLAMHEFLGKKRFKLYSKHLVLQRVLLIGFSLVLYYVMGINGIILGMFLSFLFEIITIYKTLKGSTFQLSEIKHRFRFMMHTYGLDLSRVLANSFDRLLILPIYGYVLLGNYHLGVQLVLLMSIVPITVYSYVLPQEASGKSNKRLKIATVMISIVFAIIGVTLTPIIIPFIFPAYTEAVQIMQITSLAIIPISINHMLIAKFLALEKSSIVAIGSGIYIATQIILIIVLGSFYGIQGVAIALVGGATAESMFFLTMNHKFVFPDSQKVENDSKR